jgi:hypothetical protein
MNAIKIYLNNQAAVHRAQQAIADVGVDASACVRITRGHTKSAQARGLQWMWNKEVAISGIGSADTAEDVHLASKWRWAVPILKRIDPVFPDVWAGILAQYGKEPKVMKWVVGNLVSTEGPGFPIGEYLTEFERHWRAAGVGLTIPDQGLLQWCNDKEAKNNELI